MELYTTEELRLIDGFIVPFLSRRSSTVDLRDAYLRVHRHIQENALDQTDLRRIRIGLQLFLPCFAGERDSQIHLIRALATANRLLGGTA